MIIFKIIIILTNYYWIKWLLFNSTSIQITLKLHSYKITKLFETISQTIITIITIKFKLNTSDPTTNKKKTKQLSIYYYWNVIIILSMAQQTQNQHQKNGRKKGPVKQFNSIQFNSIQFNQITCKATVHNGIFRWAITKRNKTKINLKEKKGR